MDNTEKGPVLVFIKSLGCNFCIQLSQEWNRTNGRPGISDTIKREYPNIRIVEVVTDNYNPHVYPPAIIEYINRYGFGGVPFLMLVPGPEWDYAMSDVHPDSSVRFSDAVVPLNRKVDSNGKYTFVNDYDMRKHQEWIKWISDTLKSPAFKEAQAKVYKGTPPRVEKDTVIQESVKQGETESEEKTSTTMGTCSSIRIIGRRR